ncbi:dysbindin-like [Denticeps clupeoides]|uniref:Dysbindin n=1 Tax=Denticeps clupeoides TaxID=299321 RepID=A0AAY4CWY9_9TELE|nr:dysbindin-like [Denticeps clupeoides]
MTATGGPNHSKRLPSETEHTQVVLDMDTAQQLKSRERQRFFEEANQHDVDVYLSTTHLHIDFKKPPMGSISSMEVNVDMLEQMDLMDISDQEALDVFLNSGGDGGSLASPRPDNVDEDVQNEVVYRDGMALRVRCGRQVPSNRISSTSSTTSDADSLENSEGGMDTPVIQSDEEEVQVDSFPLASMSPAKVEEDDDNVADSTILS